jgi:4-hydroxy-tetrahydrodipicolinate synthase
MKKNSWSGVFPAVVTHFVSASDFSVDVPAMKRHVDAMLRAGVDGFIFLGTLGENTSLEYGEKMELLRGMVEHVKGRVPVLSGVAEYTTKLACRFAADAKKVGCDGLMVLPGMVYKSDRRETIGHFRAVAQASDLRIMIYNNPVAYGVDITPEMLGEIGDEKHFVAVKESSENTRRVVDIHNECGDRYAVFCGVDDLIVEAHSVGAIGWVAGLVNAFPVENATLWKLLGEGKREEALKLYRWYAPLLHLDPHPKLVQYIKLAMSECGLGSEVTRPPRLAIVGEERERVTEIIRAGLENRPRS